MTRRNKLIYWLSTGWLAFGMTAQGVAQVAHKQDFVDMMTQLGYPAYLLTIIGAWKLLGVVALLLPGWARLKEWAYAGFFFVMSGAAFSHLAVGDAAVTVAPAVVLLLLIGVSWYYRPGDRKIMLQPAV